jgi:hypothetical protein
MNVFAQRFSSTGPLSELRRANALSEEGADSDAMWGSQAGFGDFRGTTKFAIPAVQDVRYRSVISGSEFDSGVIAHGFPSILY